MPRRRLQSSNIRSTPCDLIHRKDCLQGSEPCGYGSAKLLASIRVVVAPGPLGREYNYGSPAKHKPGQGALKSRHRRGASCIAAAARRAEEAPPQLCAELDRRRPRSAAIQITAVAAVRRARAPPPRGEPKRCRRAASRWQSPRGEPMTPRGEPMTPRGEPMTGHIVIPRAFRSSPKMRLWGGDEIFHKWKQGPDGETT